MIGNYLQKEQFSSYEDFLQNFKVEVPDDFNFGYDVIDAYAEKMPEKEAIMWVNDRGEKKHVTYRAFKNTTDRCAAFLQGIGVEKGDRVMLILKRRIEWWYTMVALHKIGAVAIPATHMLTDKDILYRCHMASISCIVACGDPLVLNHVQKARIKPDMPKEKIWNMQLNEQIIILGDGDKQSFLKYKDRKSVV